MVHIRSLPTEALQLQLVDCARVPVLTVLSQPQLALRQQGSMSMRNPTFFRMQICINIPTLVTCTKLLSRSLQLCLRH